MTNKKCKQIKTFFFFRLKELLLMYRIQFNFIDVILANATSLKTTEYFTALWNQQFIDQGNN